MKRDAPAGKALGRVTEAGGTGETEGKGEVLPLTQAAPPLSRVLLCHRHTCPPQREHSHNSAVELVPFCLALLSPTSYGIRALAAFRVVDYFLLFSSPKTLQ